MNFRIDDEMLCEITGIDRKSLITMIRKYKSDLEEFGEVVAQDHNTGDPLGGRPRRVYLLNTSQCRLIISYMANTSMVRALKKSITNSNVTGGDMENGKIVKKRLVYLLKASDMSVKVGVTSNIKKRANAIRTQSGKRLEEIYTTDFCSNALEIESYMKKKYESNRLYGEWFLIDYKMAVADLKKAFSEMSYTEYENQEVKDMRDDAIDCITNFTATVNRICMECVAPRESIDEIYERLSEFGKYLEQKGMRKYAPGVIRRFLGVAFESAGLDGANGLRDLDRSELDKVYLYELIVSDSIRYGIEQEMDYKEIYKICKERCSQARQIAMIGG